jgi:pimeloyl-ACP methyl ester carboxylesterase
MSYQKTYVLVHGAWHGSWCWARVRAALSDAGHSVFTPTLTGVGERSHLLAPHINLSTHISDVANLIKWEALSNVILCGHSYAGGVISGVADRIPKQIGALVYLDAFVLGNGESTHDVLPAEAAQMQISLANEQGAGWKVPPIPAVAFNVNEADREWVDRQCTAHPLACFTEKLVLSGAGAAIADVTYVEATDYPESVFAGSRERARSHGWKLAEIFGGHDVMLDKPQELVSRLLAVGKT